jgi:hypothetical protein
MAGFRGSDLRHSSMFGACLDGAMVLSVSRVKEELELALFGGKGRK